MIPMLKSLRHLFVVLLCLLPLFAQAAPDEPLEADHIVAVVGNEVITAYELQERLNAALVQLKKQGTPLPSQDVLERQMLERVIMDHVQLQYARDSGMKLCDLKA